MSRRLNLGKILRGISEEKEKEKTPSVVDEINRACSNGLTSVGSFSMIGIKRQLKSLLKSLDDESFNRDKFFSDFNTLYSLVMAPDKRAVGVFHPSQLLDGCIRQMTYELSKEEPSDKMRNTVGAELQRTFDVGTWYHLYVQNILYKLGILEQAEVPVVNKGRYINGKADGVFKKEFFGEKVVLEIKTMNSWNFKKAVFRPFKKHEFQASLYARELNINKVLYLYINKDTSEIKEFLMPVNKEQLELADSKMNEVIECVKKGTLPNRLCEDKFSDLAIACPFCTKCFKE